MVSGMLVVAVFPAFSAKKVKNETIETSAMGTGTQMGQVTSSSVELYAFSTPEDKRGLAEAFAKRQIQGFVNVLTKMHAVGHISITGTLGYDLAYIPVIPTPTGRKIRFVTNRLLRFVEVLADSQSRAFNLTGGEFDLDDAGKKKVQGYCIRSANLLSAKTAGLKSNSARMPGNL
jgi:hypothetical protein